MANGPYRVEHDRSKNLLAYDDFLTRYIRHDEAIMFCQSDISSITFPLRLQSVTQVDFEISLAIQLADVMIGAVIEAANALTEKSPNAQSVTDHWAVCG